MLIFHLWTNIQTHPLLALICWSSASGVQRTFIELQEMLQFSSTTIHGILKKVECATHDSAHYGRFPVLDLELLIYAHALFMEHDHPSYAHIICQMSLTHWVKFKSNVFAQILHHCGVSSLKTQLTK
jgi:hypothetical protein